MPLRAIFIRASSEQNVTGMSLAGILKSILGARKWSLVASNVQLQISCWFASSLDVPLKING